MAELFKKETLTSNKVTIKDIARLAQVSAAAVSNALSGKSNISAAMREKILSTAEELGYTPNTTARSLTLSNIRIAVVMSDNPEVIAEQFKNGFKKAVKEYSGAKLECDIITYTTTDRHAAAAFEQVINGGYDGLIISFPNIHEYKHTELIDKINALNIPIVSFVDELSRFNTCANVMVDALTGGSIAADIIGNCTSIKKAAIFTAVNPLQIIHKRYVDGFKESLNFYGVDICDIFYSTDISQNAIDRARDCFSQQEPPEAAFVTCYNAFEVCCVLKELGMAGKIKTVGVDITEQARQCLMDGSLTAAIFQRQDEQAVKAFEELINRIVNRSTAPYRNILITPNIITKGRISRY